MDVLAPSSETSAPRDADVSGGVRRQKVLIETWGCQMNVADSERMLALLARENYDVTDVVDDADVVLLNTCNIREKARHKVLSRLGVLARIKKDRPELTVGVTGCVAQADGKRLLSEAPTIDLLLGPGKIDELPALLRSKSASMRKGQPSLQARPAPLAALGFHSPDDARSVDHAETVALGAAAFSVPLRGKCAVSRFVTVAQGCDNFCTFCIVPHTRGREISRRSEDILTECRRHVASGAREITILGQNVNSYGQDLVRAGLIPETEKGSFVDLLEAVAEVPGLERLRFTTSNPHDFTRPLARAFAERPVLGRYMHLPVQSGSDEVLARMRRKVTVAAYWERVGWLRAACPDIALSTDLIVGFPGETDEQFRATLELVQALRFAFVYAFKYSPRRSTAASRFPDQISETVKDRRLAELNALQNEITIAQQIAEIGLIREVLFAYESQREPGIIYGRTEHFRLIRVSGSTDLVGSVHNVRITEANKTALVGTLDGPESEFQPAADRRRGG